VRGGQGADDLVGDAGDDPHVNGNLGDDEVYGGDGNDTVYGGQGNDFVFGDAGNDQLSGDLGNDTLTGGGGADRFMMRPDGGGDVIMDFHPEDGDRIVIAAGAPYSASANLGPAVIDLGGGASLTLAGVFWFDASWVVAA
jgi:Ca2+-binding RTX toxin-like protein